MGFATVVLDVVRAKFLLVWEIQTIPSNMYSLWFTQNVRSYVRWTPSCDWKREKRENWESYVIRNNLIGIFYMILLWNRGPDSSVGIATDYGVDDPGSNLGGDEIFRPSRPVLGPTQPPVKWVLGLSRG